MAFELQSEPAETRIFFMKSMRRYSGGKEGIGCYLQTVLGNDGTLFAGKKVANVGAEDVTG